jgi:hypothetical protein
MTLLSGAARVDITPGAGVELMGYGLRTEPSRGAHDALDARALYLGPAGGEDRGILLVSADLCLIAPGQARQLRERIAGQTGLPWGHVLIGCTHTHSGPETGVAALVRGKPQPEHVGHLMSGIVEAAVSARGHLRPARLRWGRAEVLIGCNRRTRNGPLDPDVHWVRVEAEGGGTIAVLFHHGCHATVLGHENLEISADWPGAAATRIEQETGAVALFLLGAHADVDPRTRGLKDLAIPGQSVGLGFEAVNVLGTEVAEAVLSGLSASATGGREGPIAVAREHARVALHLGELSSSEAEAALAARRQQLADLLGRSGGEFPRRSQLEGVVRERVRGLPLLEARDWIALVRAYIRDKTAPLFVGGRRQLDVEVQVFWIGEIALLALPMELTVEVGLDWKDRTELRGLRGLVVSIANGWLRYLPHPRDLAHPESHQHYEVLSSLLAPGSCEKLLALGERLLDQLLAQAPVENQR